MVSLLFTIQITGPYWFHLLFYLFVEFHIFPVYKSLITQACKGLLNLLGYHLDFNILAAKSAAWSLS